MHFFKVISVLMIITSVALAAEEKIPKNPCSPSPCRPYNAHCQVINNNPICTCPAGFTGDPFVRCYAIEDKEKVHHSKAAEKAHQLRMFNFPNFLPNALSNMIPSSVIRFFGDNFNRFLSWILQYIDLFRESVARLQSNVENIINGQNNTGFPFSIDTTQPFITSNDNTISAVDGVSFEDDKLPLYDGLYDDTNIGDNEWIDDYGSFYDIYDGYDSLVDDDENNNNSWPDDGESVENTDNSNNSQSDNVDTNLNTSNNNNNSLSDNGEPAVNTENNNNSQADNSVPAANISNNNNSAINIENNGETTTTTNNNGSVPISTTETQMTSTTSVLETSSTTQAPETTPSIANVSQPAARARLVHARSKSKKSKKPIKKTKSHSSKKNKSNAKSKSHSSKAKGHSKNLHSHNQKKN